MKTVKQKSQSICILKTKHFKEKLFKLMNPGIKKEYELYIQDLIKDLNNQKKIKSSEKNNNENEEKEKSIIHIDINLIQYILNKSRRTDDDLLILKYFLTSLDFLSFIKIKGGNEKLLFSLIKYLKMESKPKNTILFRYGNKGTKFYIVFSGQLSVLILKEMKVNISYIRYFIHLLSLKLLKEDGLLYKIISSNFGANRVDKNEFDYYYESINKFINKYFGKFSNKNRFFFPQENEDENIKALFPNFNQKNHYKELLEDLDLVLDSELSSSEDEEEREEKSILLGNKNIPEVKKIKIQIKKEKDIKKIKRKEILKKNRALLKIYKINKNLNYSELPIFQIDQKKVKLIVVFYIFCKELISNKKQFLSVDDYINFTFLNSPMHKSIKCENDISETEEFNLFQYFEIAKKKKGDTFGELALQHSDNQRTGTILALSDTVLGYLTKNDYDLSLSNIELKKRKKEVDFIMSFSIFSQMNWFVFENKYFNYFIKEKFVQGDKIMVQGQKIQKLFFIVDGQYEISTALTLKKIYSILKSKMRKHLDIRRRHFNNKTYNVRLYISSHQDLLGLNDCCFYEGVSFVDATCISLESTVLTLEASILKEIKQKSPEIEMDIKKLIYEKQNIMIDRLKSFYNKILNSLDYLNKERHISSSFIKDAKLKLNNKKRENNFKGEYKNYNKRLIDEKKAKYLSSPIKSKADINIDNLNNYSNKNGNNFVKIYINTEVKSLKMHNPKNNSMIINNKFDSFIKSNNKSGFNTDRWKNEEKEDYRKDKINQIMKFKSFRSNQKKRFILNSSKLNRISNNHLEKKLIKLYSPINKIISKEYSILFNWIESNNNIKQSLKDKLRYNTENKSIEIDKSNSNNKTNLLAQTISFKKKSNKNINIRKLTHLNISRIEKKSKKNIIEESYNNLLNDSNKYKKNNKIKIFYTKKQNKNINIKQNFNFKNNLDYREKRLKRLFTQFLKNASPFVNKTRQKINLKKEQRKNNIISNFEENNNLSEYTNKKLNLFLCNEITKKEYEQKNNYSNNKALSFFELKIKNRKDFFK